MRFLIVDDDHTCRRIMQFFLKPYGESVVAEGGREAVEAHKKALEDGAQFDVVYLDMVMPNFSGLDVLAAFRENESLHGVAQGVPVVMLTGETDLSHINMAKSFGVVEYLLKPIQEERVLHGLERLELVSDE